MNALRRAWGILSYRVEDFMDSYWHYREQVGLGRLGALHRAWFYETKGREPWA